jgi:WD40 repeat protein
MAVNDLRQKITGAFLRKEFLTVLSSLCFVCSDIPLKILTGHVGRVTCLLYPFNECTRYESHYLLSGGQDFSVIMWDVYSGARIHTFKVHGGVLEQLIVPPATCSVSNAVKKKKYICEFV